MLYISVPSKPCLGKCNFLISYVSYTKDEAFYINFCLYVSKVF